MTERTERGGEVRFRAAAPDTVLVEQLDVLTAVYHRASGMTHLLAEPAPEIMAVLAGGPLGLGAMLARLGEAYALGAGNERALASRLDELVAAGLVEVV